MSQERRPVGEDDLEAYVDGRLDGPRLAAVEALLASDATLQARVAADRTLRDDLRERLSPVAAQPIPARLRVDAIVARRSIAARRRLSLAAASVALLAVGTGGGWMARGWSGPTQAMAAAPVDAIQAHRVFSVEVAHPVEVGATQQAHLVQWLSRRVGHALKAPDLSALGFELMGGRVIPDAGRAAAQFMYQDGSGRRLTLFVKAESGGRSEFRFVQDSGLTAFWWVDDGLSFALVAGVDRPALLALAEAAYRQLAPDEVLPAVAR